MKTLLQVKKAKDLFTVKDIVDLAFYHLEFENHKVATGLDFETLTITLDIKNLDYTNSLKVYELTKVLTKLGLIK